MNVFSDIIRAMYPVSDESIGKLWAHAEIITLQKGEFLIKDGTVNRNLYLIKSGLLRSFHLEGDREDTLWFATDGDAVASMHSITPSSPKVRLSPTLSHSQRQLSSKFPGQPLKRCMSNATTSPTGDGELPKKNCTASNAATAFLAQAMPTAASGHS